MGKYVLFGIVVALLRGASSLPQNRQYLGHLDHKEKPNKRSSGNEGDGGKIIWGGDCSPRYTSLYSTEDALLECEAFVPTGTVFTWHKGNKEYHSFLQAAKVEEITNDVEWNDLASSPNLKLGSTVYISTILYIDCASADDKGEYMLSVETPNGRIQNRFFGLNVTAATRYHMPGGTCAYGRNIMEYIPRIYQYAKQVVAFRGSNVVVPCRALGRETTLVWSFDRRSIETSEKYQVLANGDLVIRDVTSKDRGVYSCRVTSNIASNFYDAVYTYFYLHQQ
ncbi:protogenin-like [Macrobrachium nipponense]|uniref:protogenin-like n=1 Tax=Macrobrachium nipponense TaxID=159736 RepID=UPI0030C81181